MNADPSRPGGDSDVPTLPKGLPLDWIFDRDLDCPRCQYNLRMLRAPRCPECGSVFRWQALLQIVCPRCGRHLGDTDSAACPTCRIELDWQRLLGAADPGLFRQYEYTRRPIRAALRTSCAALLPRRFWRSVQIEQAPNVRRLRRFRRAAIAMFLAGAGAAVFADYQTWAGWKSPVHLVFDLVMPLLLCVLTLPVVTAIALPHFTPTLSQFHVRTDQLTRCLCYSFSGVFWSGVALMPLGLAAVAVHHVYGPPGLWALPAPAVSFDFSRSVEALLSQPTGFVHAMREVAAGVGGGWILLLSFPWWWRFTFVALRRYLRLDLGNTIALLVSTQTIGLLVMLLLAALHGIASHSF